MIDKTYIRGRIIRAPKLRYTPQGRAVASCTIAQSNRRLNQETGEWETTQALYVDVALWSDARGDTPQQWAEILAELPEKTEVVFHGHWVTNQWEANGERKSRNQFTASALYINALQVDIKPTQGQFTPGYGPWAQNQQQETPF